MDGSIPLNRLPIAVIDLETTGLDIANDRIVQLGGVHMKGTVIQHEHTYNRIVNPGIEIDNHNSDVHHIDTAKVKDAPTYQDLHLDFHHFLKDKIIVGFNIGFDLAILRNETARLKINPLDYRYLDIRLLGHILSIPPQILHLEGLTKYYSINDEKRHDALGDSLITAAIFSRFIPLLQKKNIKTLGAAELQCFEKIDFFNHNYSDDWYYPKPILENKLPIKEQEWNRLERIDPFPFSHTVNEFMSSNLLIIHENATVVEAAKKMSQKKMGSILIHEQNDPHNILGIFTERDLLNHFAEKSVSREVLIKELMKYPIKTIPGHAFIYQAIQIMVEFRSRHLLVVNQESKPIGVISQRDFLKTRLENFYHNQHQIQNINEPDKLAELHAEIPVLARRLIKEELSTDRIAQIISSECNAIVKKSCTLAEQKMQADGHGPPPCSYAVLVLGSTGRGESLLSFDQDNAIVYQEENTTFQTWFLSFGKILNDILHTAGIPYCKGKVMAGNEKWCLSLKAWENCLNHWFTSSKPEAILNTDIFVDFIHVDGDPQLSYALRDHLTKLGKGQNTFLKIMGEEINSNLQVPLSMFGNIKTTNGRLDMKKWILFPIVATARLLSLRIGFAESNHTRERLNYAMEKMKLNDYEIEIINEMYQLAMSMILEQQLQQISLGGSPNNEVHIKLFKKRKVERLRTLLPYLEGLKTMIHRAIVEVFD